MKVFALILLCALAAVQGRSAGVQNTRALAALGDTPWLVHLRIARSNTGLLSTCVGSLVDARWVLTSASCLNDFYWVTRFIWVRYGVVNVLNPSLVTENSAVRLHPSWDSRTGENNIALISINRDVHPTEYISPVALPYTDSIPKLASFCGFGEESEGPGELLSCIDLALEAKEDGYFVGSSEDGEVSQFDIGAPLVSEGVQVGILVSVEDGVAKFLSTGPYAEWIESETGLVINPESPTTSAPTTEV